MKVDLDGLIRVTNAKPSKDGWYIGKCVAHSDNKPSLAFKYDNNGHLALKCFSGCCREDILENLLHIGVVAKGNYLKKNIGILHRSMKKTLTMFKSS